MAVLPTSPLALGGLTALLVFMGSIVAISHAIAYYEMSFYSPADLKMAFCYFEGLGLA
jgi:hypothetical protein